jgi:drug/metabolite transporter (DMT)-like permease
MQSFALAIVVASTFTHAYWNFLLKRAGGAATFIALSKAAEVVCFAPVFLWLAMRTHEWSIGVAGLMAVGAVLVLLNYGALAKAYAAGDLSFVYPISRAGILLFLPALGFVVFRERMTIVGWGSVACIVAGIALLQVPAFTTDAIRSSVARLNGRSVGYSLAAALSAAVYTVWDKRAVQTLTPFVYFYGYTLLVAVLYLVFVWRRTRAAEIARVWSAHRASIVQVGIFNTVTYLLVLFALRSGTSSYVIAVRQLSIVWGALLGYFVLGESLPAPKRIGLATLVMGCVMVAFAK